MQTYELPNGERTARFAGDLLAHSTSYEDEKIRWTEVNIYRTAAGKYILQKLGVSTVYHTPNHASPETIRKSTKRLLMEGGKDLLQPCPVCKPGTLLASEWVALERNRSTVHVSDTPEGLVECAKTQDSDGVVFMSRTADTALRAAARQDLALREAYLVEEIA